MSKSLLTTKLIGGGVLGTGAVAAGGYGIDQYIKSNKETTEETNVSAESLPGSPSPSIPSEDPRNEQHTKDSQGTDGPEGVTEGQQNQISQPKVIEDSIPASDGSPAADPVPSEDTLKETSVKAEKAPEEKDSLQKARDEILNWAAQHGGCKVTIKHNNFPTEIGVFDNKEDLKSLLSAFTGEKKDRFESECKGGLRNKGVTDQTPTMSVEKTEAGKWDFDDTDE